MPGLVDLQVEKQVLIPQLKVTPDYERAALYGITPAALTEALEGLSSGRVVSQIVEGNRRFDVVMRISDENRSTTGLQDLLVSTPQGFVPLRLLAKVEEGDGPNQILRENGQRRIVVSGQRRRQARHGGDRRRRAPHHRRDRSCRRATSPQLEGTFRAQEEAALVIGMLSLVSLALIFMVLYQRYQSAVLAAIILTNIPLALIGSVIALWLAGPAAVGGLDDRLHHAGRHRRAQRHPQDQPLHQPGAVRGRDVRAGARRPRQPGAAGARADDGAVRRAWRWCRCCSAPASPAARSCIRWR